MVSLAVISSRADFNKCNLIPNETHGLLDASIASFRLFGRNDSRVFRARYGGMNSIPFLSEARRIMEVEGITLLLLKSKLKSLNLRCFTNFATSCDIGCCCPESQPRSQVGFRLVNVAKRTQIDLDFKVNGALVVQSLHPTRWPETVGGTSRSDERSQSSSAVAVLAADVSVGDERLLGIVVILKIKMRGTQ